MTGELNEAFLLQWLEQMTIQEAQEAGPSPQFAAVQNAVSRIYACLTGAYDVKVRFNLDCHRVELITTDRNTNMSCLPLNLLSDGYKRILSLVLDIACRMAVLNPHLRNRVLAETPGIVLIDDIELHLHPRLQQRIPADLQSIFPCVQFVASTHAPCIIQSVRKENLLVLSNALRAVCPSEEVYGNDANTVHSCIMGADKRVPSVQQAFQAFYDAIDQAQLAQARDILDALKVQIETRDPELVAVRVTLVLEEL